MTTIELRTSITAELDQMSVGAERVFPSVLQEYKSLHPLTEKSTSIYKKYNKMKTKTYLQTSLMAILFFMISVLQINAQPKEQRYLSQFKDKGLKVQKWCEAEVNNRIKLYYGSDNAIVSIGKWNTAKPNARISFIENGMILNGFMGYNNTKYTIPTNNDGTLKATLEAPLCTFSRSNEKDINVNVYQIKGETVILAFRIGAKWYQINCKK